MACQPKTNLEVVIITKKVKSLLETIGRIAHEHGISAYAVGGCVRDWLLGISETIDIDVAIEGDGVRIARLVSRALDGTLKIHEQFGTATLNIGCVSGVSPKQDSRVEPIRVDFASCRKESYAKPSAYPKVSPGSLEDDLVRRDFTINAMAIAIGPGRFGNLIDPFYGACDIERRMLQILHDRSFIDDPSRILRGIRFAQRFCLRWEPKTLRCARAAIAAGALGLLNEGRLYRELDRMLDEPSPRGCFRQLEEFLEPVS